MDSQEQQPPPVAPPSIPPRPSRVKAHPVAASGGEGVALEASAAAHAAPIIPPRPVRSKSPHPKAAHGEVGTDNVDISPAAASAAPPLPPRQQSPPPPAVESERKASVDPTPEAPQPPIEKKTATVPSDMEVHAPVAAPAVPSTRPGFLRSTSHGTGTPPRGGKGANLSGIPEIGRQVPMYPNAGDVQAPTPTPSRQAAIPALQKRIPGSASPFTKKEDYGEYGSGLHPLERRSGHYSLSSEDLNYIVAKTSKSQPSGGVPDEDIGYMATEEYAKKIGTATPREELTENEATKQFNIDASKIRDGSTSPELTIHVQPRAHQRAQSHPYGKQSNQGRFSQSSSSLVTGAGNNTGSTENIPEDGEGDDQFRDENYRGTPILASDEVTKRGTSTPHLAAAISPVIVRRTPSRPASRPPSRPPSRGAMRESQLVEEPLAQVEEHEPLFPDSDDERKDNHTALREGVAKALGVPTSSSKRSSRKFPSNDIWEDAPASSHLSATVASPPPGLAPLSPEQGQNKDEEDTTTTGETQDEESDRLGVPNRHKKSTPSEEPAKPVRPVPTKTASGKQRFPSKDIWEEAPDSAQLTAEVSPTPAEVEEENISPVAQTAAPVKFPDASELSNQARPTTGVVLEGGDDRLTTNAALEGISDLEVRPPSPEKEKWAPTGAVPILPGSRPSPTSAGRVATPTKYDTQAQVEQAQKPALVPRALVTEERKAPPVIPERPKPTIPNRPARNPLKANIFQSQAAEEVTSSAKSPPPIKPKPAIGGKIAALKANLELEKRLAAGPGAFMKKKEEEEKHEDGDAQEQKEEAAPAPLVSDVRKGRTKGPRGRKLPTAAASTEKADEVEEGVQATPTPAPAPQLSFSTTFTVWTIDEDDGSRVILADSTETAAPAKPDVTETEKSKEEANEDAQTNLAQEVLTGLKEIPAILSEKLHLKEEENVAEKPTEKPESHPHHHAGLILEDEHPEDAAPKGQSSLDTEAPAAVPTPALTTEKKDLAVAAAPGESQPLEEEEWDVVSKV